MGLSVNVIKPIRYSSALLRHFIDRGTQTARKAGDYANGLRKFLIWIPSTARRLGAIYRRQHLRLSGNLNLGTDNEFWDKLQVVFINLDRRPDRREETESELASIGLQRARRFQAFSDPNGALGCARSHLRVVSTSLASGDELLMVCEDDIQMNCSRQELSSVIQEFVFHPELDVLCLGYRLRAPRLPITSRLAIANGIQTTLCYIMKAKAVSTIALSFRRSETMLSNGEDPLRASIDQQWKQEQSQQLLFCVPRKKLVLHRASHSDIAGREKDYDRAQFR